MMFVRGKPAALPMFVNAQAFGKDVSQLARFIIHELSHLGSVGALEDYIYGYKGALSTAREEPRAAIRNADNFSYYVSGLKK